MDESLLIDTDNALGSPFGDIDDAFAIAALLRSGLKVQGIGSVFGNAFEPLVFRNNQEIAGVCGYTGPILRGATHRWAKSSETSRYLEQAEPPLRIAALGPLTNIALALRNSPALASKVTELIFVATNFSARLPALRFFDFNQWKDPRALREVLASPIPLTCVPCNVARKLRATRKQVNELTGTVGKHLRRHAPRWFIRAKLLKGVDSVPIWDLAAAMYLIEPALFETRRTHLSLGTLGQGIFGRGTDREVTVVTGFDPDRVWSRFRAVIKE